MLIKCLFLERPAGFAFCSIVNNTDVPTFIHLRTPSCYITFASLSNISLNEVIDYLPILTASPHLLSPQQISTAIDKLQQYLKEISMVSKYLRF